MRERVKEHLKSLLLAVEGNPNAYIRPNPMLATDLVILSHLAGMRQPVMYRQTYGDGLKQCVTRLLEELV